MTTQQQLTANRNLSLWVFDTLCNDILLNENDRCALKVQWMLLCKEHSLLEKMLDEELQTSI